ncbi:hypothetical protein C9374_007205 [Naegleria lovaniensis]|uniref:Myb domain-containing protein n=1 Tax=Naegleria lovaniensis TaxID=51637 RepID=A0AA88GZW0_NAELO|nr:uncharacterized protein C9374_007205 [Naegleria lovaniensis]KAG2393674.1 hypothetical protein C9374_007205 [Naegleria lovaniensis]
MSKHQQQQFSSSSGGSENDANGLNSTTTNGNGRGHNNSTTSTTSNRLSNVLDLRGVNDQLPDNYIQPTPSSSLHHQHHTTTTTPMISLESVMGVRSSSSGTLSENPNLYQGHINFHHSVHHDGHHILDHVDPDQFEREQQRLRQFNSHGGPGSLGLPSIPNLPQSVSAMFANSSVSHNGTNINQHANHHEVTAVGSSSTINAGSNSASSSSMMTSLRGDCSTSSMTSTSSSSQQQQALPQQRTDMTTVRKEATGNRTASQPFVPFNTGNVTSSYMQSSGHPSTKRLNNDASFQANNYLQQTPNSYSDNIQMQHQQQQSFDNALSFNNNSYFNASNNVNNNSHFNTANNVPNNNGTFYNVNTNNNQYNNSSRGNNNMQSQQQDDYSQDVILLVVEQQKRIYQLEEELQRAQDYINKLQEYVTFLESEKEKNTKKQSRYWTQEEHKLFLEGIEKYGKKDVKAIASHVGTRNATQVRTHAQKYYAKIDREQKKVREKKLEEAKKRQPNEKTSGHDDESKTKKRKKVRNDDDIESNSDSTKSPQIEEGSVSGSVMDDELSDSEKDNPVAMTQIGSRSISQQEPPTINSNTIR